MLSSFGLIVQAERRKDLRPVFDLGLSEWSPSDGELDVHTPPEGLLLIRLAINLNG